jgi:8-oxo-dGTP pyrophosphatase MutT (NUDIX family)
VPLKASTVMLVRPADPANPAKFRGRTPIEERVAAPNGIELFMIRRQKSMSFAPDAVVFPGGRVDPKDADPALPWAGPSPAEWAAKLHQSEDDARRIVVAAVREVFEECGVLLAGHDANSVVRDVSTPEWGRERDRLIAHEQGFAEVLIRHKLFIRSDLLSYCANWVTPEFSPKRFDTFFFAALCPEGQTPDDCSTEASIADWVEPQWAFDLGDAGEIILLPPTIYNLNFVYHAKDLDELLNTDRPHIQFMEEGAIDENGEHVVTGVLP